MDGCNALRAVQAVFGGLVTETATADFRGKQVRAGIEGEPSAVVTDGTRPGAQSHYQDSRNLRVRKRSIHASGNCRILHTASVPAVLADALATLPRPRSDAGRRRRPIAGGAVDIGARRHPHIPSRQTHFRGFGSRNAGTVNVAVPTLERTLPVPCGKAG